MQPKHKILTLCIVLKNKKILLGMKKRGFGAGRWNGFGGKVEEGETIEGAALRELFEESGIKAQDLKKAGIIEFEFQDDPKILEVHIFSASNFDGEPIESDEMRPQWFDFEKIPYDEMWSDDIYWLPLLIKGKKFKGKFLFDRPSTAEYSAKILKEELVEIQKL